MLQASLAWGIDKLWHLLAVTPPTWLSHACSWGKLVVHSTECSQSHHTLKSSV